MSNEKEVVLKPFITGSSLLVVSTILAAAIYYSPTTLYDHKMKGYVR